MKFVGSHPSRLFVSRTRCTPSLFPRVRTTTSRERRVNRCLLSKSRGFLLLGRISRSLTNQINVVRLLPLDCHRTVRTGPSLAPSVFVFQNKCPRLRRISVPRTACFQDCVAACVRHSITRVLSIHGLRSFHAFLGLYTRGTKRLIGVDGLTIRAKMDGGATGR